MGRGKEGGGAQRVGGNMSNIVNIKGGDAVEISIHWGKETEETIYIHEEIISDGSKQNCRSAFFKFLCFCL